MSKLIVFTGAGLSADSGLKTFRDSNGLWEQHDVDQIANIDNFRKNFDLVHRFYNERRTQAATAIPNTAHHSIRSWQKRYDAVVITQNVDGLLEAAGCVDVMHVHGRLNDMKCLMCRGTWEIDPDVPWTAGRDACPKCGSKLDVKPGIIMFNEDAPLYRDMYNVLGNLETGDVLVVIGTSGQVVDIGSIARASKATTILSNLESDTSDWMPGRAVIWDEFFNIAIHGRAPEMALRLDHLVRGLLGDGRYIAEDDYGG
jgi:NAD-dependent deacetylase